MTRHDYRVEFITPFLVEAVVWQATCRDCDWRSCEVPSEVDDSDDPDVIGAYMVATRLGQEHVRHMAEPPAPDDRAGGLPPRHGTDTP